MTRSDAPLRTEMDSARDPIGRESRLFETSSIGFAQGTDG